MNTNTFQRPETIPIWCDDRNWEGTYIDPSQGITIDIYNRDGTKIVDSQPMEKATVGKYVYYYNSVADDLVGWWHYSCKAIDGSAPQKIVIVQGSFQLQ